MNLSPGGCLVCVISAAFVVAVIAFAVARFVGEVSTVLQGLPQ